MGNNIDHMGDYAFTIWDAFAVLGGSGGVANTLGLNWTLL